MLFCACLSLFLGAALAQPSGKEGGTTTVLGCIQRSQQDYVIIDNRGTSYLLDGVGDELSGEVGHTLEVKGKLIEPPQRAPHVSTESFRPAGNHGSQSATLRVSSVIDDVHRLGSTCRSQ